MMKDLTEKEWNEAPHIIQYMYAMCYAKMPMGSDIIKEGKEKYPNYFIN